MISFTRHSRHFAALVSILVLLLSGMAVAQDEESSPAPEPKVEVKSVPSEVVAEPDPGSEIVAELMADAEPVEEESGTRTLAIVRDSESWYFDNFVTAMQKELATLSAGNYELVTLDDFNGGSDPKVISAQLLKAVSTPEVNAVYAAGVVATERASRMEVAKRVKPIVGGALQFSDTRRQISDLGRSTAPNFSFTTAPQRVSADLALAKRLSGNSNVHIIIDRLIKADLVELDNEKKKVDEKIGVTVSFVWASTNAKETLALIPDSATSAYVTILPRMSLAERKKLYAGLAKRGIPSVSMHGLPEVRDAGAMAGLNADNLDSIARRSALNIHQLLTGSKTGDLPVLLPIQDQLYINASTAAATGWSPDYDISLEADFLNEPRTGFRKITLKAAMELAAAQNIEVLIAREDEAIARGDVAIGRSALLPQIGFGANHGRTGISSRIDPQNTPNHSHKGTYGLELRQVLFNDEARSGLKAQRRTAISKQFDTMSIRYDAMESTALAYFDLLTAEALYSIEKANLRMTQDNLQLARLRQNIGSDAGTEVFRWEQDQARGRAALIQRDFERRNAMVEFSRLIGEPRETKWTSDEWTNKSYDRALESGANSKPYRTVGAKEFGFLNSALSGMIKNNRDFNKFMSFIQFMAVENSPELIAFDEVLAAQGILLEQKQRRFYLPEVSGTLGLNRAISGSDLADTDGQNEVSAGFKLSFPLYEGGKRTADIEQQQASLRKLAAQRERAVQKIEQRALTAVYGIGAAHPNIRLSDVALTAARKNFKAVQEKYLVGAATILDLLDAQSSLLGQAQEDALASFSYMQQINSVQRSIAWFEFQKSAAEKKKWESYFRLFLRNGKITTRNGTFPRSEPIPVAKPKKVSAKPAPPAPKSKTAEAKPSQKPKRKLKKFRLFKKRR